MTDSAREIAVALAIINSTREKHGLNKIGWDFLALSTMHREDALRMARAAIEAVAPAASHVHVTDSERDELLAVFDEFDDIEIDESGKCSWAHIANAQTHARARLSCLLAVSAASRLHEREKIAGILRRFHQNSCYPQALDDEIKIAADAILASLREPDDGALERAYCCILACVDTSNIAPEHDTAVEEATNFIMKQTGNGVPRKAKV